MPKTWKVIIALILGLIFFTGAATSLPAASKPAGAKKQSWKKARAKKSKG